MKLSHFLATASAASLLLPSVVFAAGFAKGSLFLSRSPVTEGESVLIHAVVQNDSSSAFSGSVVLSDADAKLGSVPVTLAAGEAEAVSVSWKPLAGSHSVSANLVSKSGDTVEQESETFVIKAKPVPVDTTSNSNSAATVESSSDIQSKIGQYSPGTESTVAPVFTLIDGGREKVADLLDQGVAWGKQTAAGQSIGDVLGAATSKDNVSNPAGAAGGVMHTLWLILGTIVLYICSVLRWLVQSAAIFYPVFLLVVLYILWRIIARFRRPKY
ncbi:MAG: hypothetical protein V4436_04115 [Patescibacteria group bacterium]